MIFSVIVTAQKRVIAGESCLALISTLDFSVASRKVIQMPDAVNVSQRRKDTATTRKERWYTTQHR
jgi:hypothetical protein